MLGCLTSLLKRMNHRRRLTLRYAVSLHVQSSYFMTACWRLTKGLSKTESHIFGKELLELKRLVWRGIVIWFRCCWWLKQNRMFLCKLLSLCDFSSFAQLHVARWHLDPELTLRRLTLRILADICTLSHTIILLKIEVEQLKTCFIFLHIQFFIIGWTFILGRIVVSNFLRTARDVGLEFLR